jgi:hypothetical protein
MDLVQVATLAILGPDGSRTHVSKSSSWLTTLIVTFYDPLASRPSAWKGKVDEIPATLASVSLGFGWAERHDPFQNPADALTSQLTDYRRNRVGRVALRGHERRLSSCVCPTFFTRPSQAVLGAQASDFLLDR